MATIATLLVRLGADADGVKRGLEKAQKFVDGASQRMRQGAIVAGAAVGAGLAAGIVQGLQKSRLDAKLSAQIGATPEVAAQLGKVSGQVYADAFGDSMATVNTAIRDVFQNGLLPKGAADADVEQMTKRLLTVSEIVEEDTARVSAAVAQMLKTGMAASAEQAFNILVRSTQEGVNKSQDLLDTLNEYSTQFRKLGLDGVGAMGLVSQAVQAGARDSDIAADALKEFSIRAIDGSKLTADGFKMIGLNAKTMASDIAAGGPKAAAALDLTLDRLRGIKDPVKQSQAAVALFGTQAEDLGAALLAMDLSSAAGQLDGLGGAADKAGKTMEESAGAKVEAFKRRLETGLIKALAETVGWIERNSELVKVLAMVLGPLIGIIVTIIAIIKIWTAVQTVLNFVMSANPIGLIILAIAALIGIIILIATKTTWFQDMWKAVWGAIQSAALAVWDWIKNKLWPGLKTVFGFIVEAIIGPPRKAIEMFGKMIDWFKTLPGKIKSAFAKLGDIIMSPFKWAFNKIASFWNRGPGRLSFRAPDWVPGLGGKGFSLPKLPMLEAGGIIRQGGAAVVADRNGRGGEVVSLPRGARVDPLPAGGREVHVVFDLVGADGEMMRLMRKAVRVRGRGSAQTAFGRRQAATG